jgi:23S rRNA (pseudouridine1915-N3)-methyltransferase
MPTDEPRKFFRRERVAAFIAYNEECARFLKALSKSHDIIVVCDERGDALSSKEFAGLIGRHRDQGDAMTFIIGGAYGLDDAVRTRSNYIVSFGPMTFPHELAKLMLTEQLYRAATILQGSGYHH